ncbi:MAG: OmpL47-type beta-barrel domain-containing protein, partial [Candidatus Hodarchaeales archaeon]
PVISSVMINDGATYTGSVSVSGGVQGSDATSMVLYLSNDGSSWSYKSSFKGDEVYSWKLESGDGLKTVHVKIIDGAGNEALSTDDIILDTTSPVISSVVINDGATYTGSVSVSVGVQGSDASSIVLYLSNDGSSWSYKGSFKGDEVYSWKLESGDGLKTVHVKIVDGAGNEVLASDDITLDTMNPTTRIVFSEPKYITDTNYITQQTIITLEALDSGSGLQNTYYRIYNTAYDSGWQTYVDPFTLAGLAEGQYLIDFNSIDSVGNVEITKVETLTLDNTSPSTILTVGDPQYDKNPLYVTSDTPFTLTATDIGSDVFSTSYRIYNTAYDSGWQTYVDLFTIVGLDGQYSIEFYSIDNLGNVELTKTETVFLDNTSPSTVLSIGDPQHGAGMIYVTSDTPFTLTATDTGSDVFSTSYRIYNTVYDSGWQTYVDPFTIMGLDGQYSIEFYSIDNLGNKENNHEINIMLFSWDYIFEQYCTGDIILKIDIDHKFFQFISPVKDYGIRKATRMLVLRKVIVIHHEDSELKLVSVSIDTRKNFCVVIARDLITGEKYVLFGRGV